MKPIFKLLFICLFLAALGLRCFAQAFSGCGEQRLLFTVVASLVEEGSWALGAWAP